MEKRMRKALCLLALVLLLSSCGALVSPGKEFSSVMRDYTMRLRWMDFSGAGRHFEANRREGFMQGIGGNRDLRVVDVSLESLDFSDEDRRAQTVVSLEYYILPSAIVQRFELSQEWEYQGADHYRAGVWRIVSPFPRFP